MKDPYKNFGTKNEKSKKVANTEEEDFERKNTIFNKYIANLTSQPLKEVLKSTAISK